MTSTPAEPSASAVERQMLENIHTLMMRAHLSGRALADKIGVHRAAIARRLTGDVSFLYMEVRAIAQLMDVTLDELETTLPSYDEWRARRDSNPQPSDLEPPAPCPHCGYRYGHLYMCPNRRPVLRLIHGSGQGVVDYLRTSSPRTMLRLVPGPVIPAPVRPTVVRPAGGVAPDVSPMVEERGRPPAGRTLHLVWGVQPTFTPEGRTA